MTGYEAANFYDRYLSGLTPIFVKTFFSEYAGKIDYSAYTLPEDIFFGLNLNNNNNAIHRLADPGVSAVV